VDAIPRESRSTARAGLLQNAKASLARSLARCVCVCVCGYVNLAAQPGRSVGRSSCAAVLRKTELQRLQSDSVDAGVGDGSRSRVADGSRSVLSAPSLPLSLSLFAIAPYLISAAEWSFRRPVAASSSASPARCCCCCCCRAVCLRRSEDDQLIARAAWMSSAWSHSTTMQAVLRRWTPGEYVRVQG